MAKFSAELGRRERWLVLNKTDLFEPAAAAAVCADIVGRLQWTGPAFQISALGNQGCDELVRAIMTYLEQRREAPPEEAAR